MLNFTVRLLTNSILNTISALAKLIWTAIGVSAFPGTGAQRDAWYVQLHTNI